MSTVKLREVDVASLHEGNALMEGVIHYIFHKAYIIAGNSNIIFFLDPVVAHTMFAFRDASLGPIKEMCKKMILVIPIAEYDSHNYNGVHWSILLLVRKSLEIPFVAYRLDSLNDRNKERCRLFLAMLRNSEICKDFIPNNSETIKFPSQSNDVDCGCFVCLAAMHIAECVKESGVSSIPFKFPDSWNISEFRCRILEEFQKN